MPRGSAPGERRGGRKKGSPNKRTIGKRLAEATAVVVNTLIDPGTTLTVPPSGTDCEPVRLNLPADIQPLNFLLTIMREDGFDLGTRLDAAKAAAPYIHPKLAQIQHTGDAQKPIGITISDTDQQL